MKKNSTSQKVNLAKELFFILNKVKLMNDEFKNGKIHIIKTALDNEISFRVYINDSCFDCYQIEKFEHLKEEFFEYFYFNEWDNFKKVNIEDALKLVISKL